MKYLYKCEGCEHKEEFEFSMQEDQPKRILCPICKELKMRRVWSNCKNIVIPFQWNKDSYKFDKRPREKRKYK